MADMTANLAQGQLRAIWKHSVSQQDVDVIVGEGFPVLVLHGRHDILAHPKFGEQLAQRWMHCLCPWPQLACKLDPATIADLLPPPWSQLVEVQKEWPAKALKKDFSCDNSYFQEHLVLLAVCQDLVALSNKLFLPCPYRLQATSMQLEGAHFLTRECGPEVNALLLHNIRHGARLRQTLRQAMCTAAGPPAEHSSQALGVDIVNANAPLGSNDILRTGLNGDTKLSAFAYHRS